MKKQEQFVHSRSAAARECLAEEFAELSLILCGQEVCEPGIQYPPRIHDCFLLLALCRGRGSCTMNDTQYDMEDQDIILIFPGTEYSVGADPQTGCTCMWVGFTGASAEACMLHLDFSRQDPCHRTKCLPQMENILAQTFLPQVTTASQLRTKGHFQFFLADLMEECADKTPDAYSRQPRGPKTSEYVKNAMEYISKHYPEDVKIKELADFVGINRSYLSSSFKKATGSSPKEYLLKLRMEKAKSLLETTQIPISSISSAVGYEDPLAFSRIFKRYSGLSPTDYRENKKSRFE